MGVSTRAFRFHRAVIDPRRRGPALAAARVLLWAAAVPYGLGVRLRNGLYALGLGRARRAAVPVISVGNLTAGGTGKTPLVAWLARLLVIHKMRPAILSRGYGRHEGLGLDDENQMLARMAEGVPIVIDADRLRGAERAVRRENADALILDDGFQHRRIARELDIVLIDAVWPFGAGHLLPRGLLREPPGALGRAGFLLITRADLVSDERLEGIKRELARAAPGVPTAGCATILTGLRPLAGPEGSGPALDRLGEGRWAAFCGIGNPEGFRLTLRKAGCEPDPFLVFSDHEQYGEEQVRAVIEAAARAGCGAIVTTEKDAVKVARMLDGAEGPRMYALETDLEFTEGEEALNAAILAAVGRQ